MLTSYNVDFKGRASYAFTYFEVVAMGSIPVRIKLVNDFFIIYGHGVLDRRILANNISLELYGVSFSADF